MTHPAAEPWDSDAARVLALHRLLVRFEDLGPLTDDAVARWCLKPAELVGAMDDAQRAANALGAIDGLLDYLERKGRTAKFDDAIRQWQTSADAVRRSLPWHALPPAVAKRARQRAEYLLLFAQRAGYIERSDDNLHWQITEPGLLAVDQMHADGQHPGAPG